MTPDSVPPSPLPPVLRPPTPPLPRRSIGRLLLDCLGRAVRSSAAATATVALAALLLAALLHAAGMRIWPFELVHHFIPHYAIAAVATTAALWLGGRPRSAAVAFVLAAGFAGTYVTAPIPMSPRPLAAHAKTPLAFDPADGSEYAQPPLRVLTHNIYVLNRQRGQLLNWLATQPADVIALQEVNATMIKRLREAKDGYSYRWIATDEQVTRDGWRTTEAIVILSRYPIIERRSLAPAARGWQATIVRLRLPSGAQPWVVAAHPPSPVFADNLPVRDRILAQLAAAISVLDGPVIVAGDFNATPWTPAFREFVRTAALSTFERFPATYSQRLRGLGIPIDHILVRNAMLTELRALPAVGSDHRPLAATVVLPVSTAPISRAVGPCQSDRSATAPCG